MLVVLLMCLFMRLFVFSLFVCGFLSLNSLVCSKDLGPPNIEEEDMRKTGSRVFCFKGLLKLSKFLQSFA